MVSASDEEVRLEDLKGQPIYLDVPLTRTKFEELASQTIDRSIACCRDMLAHVGFRHEDVARVVLIGGPTKIPLLRRRVKDELGIDIEDITRVDPMTAVAAGAAIYCEGRNWEATGSTAKATRKTETVGRTIEVSFNFETRTASDHAFLRVSQDGGEAGAEVLIESRLGWSSGRRKLNQPVALELPLTDPGPNRFRATVFNAQGLPVTDASREIIVERLLASTGGVPATNTIAAKVLGDNGQNTLDVMVHKGTILPASGFVRYRLAEAIRAGSPGTIRIELFQIADERILEPALNLPVGEFQIAYDDLPEGAVLRKGSIVVVHWAMSEGQEITTEVELPDVGQRFDRRKYYNWHLARQNFSGEDGAKLAQTHLDLVETDLANAEEVVPPAFSASLPKLRERLDYEISAVRGTVDPDARRKAVEEARQLRQEIASVCLHPDARRDLLRRRLTQQKHFYERDVRTGATRDQISQLDTLLAAAERLIQNGGSRDLDLARDQINEVNRLYWRHGLPQDAFCIRQFRIECGLRHISRNPAAFDKAVIEGERALAAGDVAALRMAIFAIWSDQIMVGDGIGGGERASLMRA
jgi:molecular chaperone DnaK